MVKDLQKVVEQDPLAQLDEQDKELIWKMRYNTELYRYPWGFCWCVCSGALRTGTRSTTRNARNEKYLFKTSRAEGTRAIILMRVY